MTSPNPEIDPALIALLPKSGGIMRALYDYTVTCSNKDSSGGERVAAVDKLLTLIGALVLERDEAKKDAERWNWMKKFASPTDQQSMLITPWTKWDEAADAHINNTHGTRPMKAADE